MVIDGIYYALGLAAGGALVSYLAKPVYGVPLFLLAAFCLYFFRSITHSQCESPCSMFLVNLNVKFGFRLSTAPSPHL